MFGPWARAIVSPCAPVALLLIAQAAWCAEPSAAGLHDLVVLDPGKHDRGLPSVEVLDREGGKQIDIPPSVHVHRYYYSGDKEIQGPILKGGPTMVVARHPKTGKQMYIEAVLPAGAPRIAYNKQGITYVYPDQRVHIGFQHFPRNPDTAVVKHHHGRGWGRRLRDMRSKVSQHVKSSFANSPMTQSLKESTGETGDLLKGLKVSLSDLGVQGADSFKTLTNMIPGVTYLKSLAEQEPEKDYASRIRAAGIQQARAEVPFVRTNH